MASTDRPSRDGSDDGRLTNNAAPHAHHYSAEELHNEDVAHEHSDVNIRTILAFGGGLAAVVVVCAVLMWGLFRVLEGQAAENDPQVSPLARPAGQPPLGPVLLTNEPATLEKLREQELKTLQGYGWVDQPGGVAHMPIADAKKLIVQRGLPVRSEGTADAQTGTNVPAMLDASSGRTVAVPNRTTGTPTPPAADHAPAAAEPVKK
jgi:hypothetical protein